VVRHAEVHNPRDILYGRLPRFRLSGTGRKQADVTGRFTAGRSLAAIYTSPILRARQTADILSTYHPGVPIKRTDDLLEVRTSYQGEPNSILKPGFSFYEPRAHPSDESMEDIWLRMCHFLQTAARRHAGQAVAAVTHADPITVMRVGLERKEMTAKNLHGVLYPARASVTQIVLRPDAPFTLAYFNPANVSEIKL
jgi:broad specificity phosphatase PhoE